MASVWLIILYFFLYFRNLIILSHLINEHLLSPAGAVGPGTGDIAMLPVRHV